jgi:hypothetical protein
MGGEGEGCEKRMGERGQNKLWDRAAMVFSTGEGWRLNWVRVEMRGL